MESTHTHGTGFLGRATAALLPAESLSKWLSAAGMSVFMLMVFLTFVDVFLRYWFGKSINGTVEITELMMVIVVFPPPPTRNGRKATSPWIS
ncbi:MAG: TRAP transporter small permease [Bilophila wadsworthia]